MGHQDRLDLLTANKSFPLQMYKIRLDELKRSIRLDCKLAGVSWTQYVSLLRANSKSGAISDMDMLAASDQDITFAVKYSRSSSSASILQFADDTAELRDHLHQSFKIDDLL